MGDENKVAKRKKSIVKAKLIALIAVIVIALGAGLYFGKSLSSESRITKLSFEDMGELATQAAYCTMVEDTESFKLYLEDESIFRRISMEENNDSMIEMEENARRQAVGNGLLDEARANAEAILRSFFAGVYDLEKYEIVFTDK